MQDSDLNELKGLVAEIRADHVERKEKEKRDAWTKYVSLTMVVIAVLAAYASLKGGGFSTRSLKDMNEATYNQSQASDQWSYYEAKSIKQNLYEIELEHLGAGPAADVAAVAKVKAKVDKYEKDRADITALAKRFEAERDAARQHAVLAAAHSRVMGLAITLFQVAIALGAMCLIVKRKPLWVVSMVLGGMATAEMVRALYLLPQ